ncbi:MAG TPA: SDR family oxidoreductase [Candidatus Polarisedimenticolaceae bacterium]|nr:SDR family oxidoreductase [Candidatus Polarisedimenticolaceae bacterium]
MDLHALTGRRALVCGGTRGIGRAVAEELARRGASVIVFARDAAAMDRVCAELPGSGHAWLAADFHDNEAVRSGAAAEVRDRGPIQILINNTGGPPGGPIADAAPEAFVAAFRAHLVNNQILAQTLIPGMTAGGYGRIVNIVSTSVREPIAGLGVSNTVRAAVAGWAKTLAGELARFGITVNNVLPGYTKTGRLDAIIAGRAAAAGRSAEELAREIAAQIPAGRFAEAWEVAAAVGFLASPAAGYITGTSLPVDGGRIAAL